MSQELLHKFARKGEATSQGEVYVVRDNGAICRRSRFGKRRRSLYGRRAGGDGSGGALYAGESAEDGEWE